MCRHVTDPADPSRDRLEFTQATDPPRFPVATLIMARTFDRFVSLVSHAERIWSQLDWAEIRRIVRDGLVAFVALMILCCIVTVESTVAAYKWAQPRLANLLQHPWQTVTNGPVELYGESVAAVMLDTATVAERFIVSVGAFAILKGEEFADLKYKASRFKVWMMGPSIRLDWGNVSYSMVAWNRGHLSIWGQRMV